MEIYNKARELAELLLQTDEGKAMADARFIYEGNEEAKKLLFNYSQYRDGVQVKMESGTFSQEEFEKEKEKLDAMIAEVRANPIIADMINAENQFNALANQVMNVFKATIMGQDEDSCGGNCGSCGGCH